MRSVCAPTLVLQPLPQLLFLLQPLRQGHQRPYMAYNLTAAVREPLEMVPKHLLDSLSVLPHLYGDDLLDVGTRPGLPGIPLGVAAPERTFCLLDSNGKKTRFLRQVVMELWRATCQRHDEPGADGIVSSRENSLPLSARRSPQFPTC